MTNLNITDGPLIRRAIRSRWNMSDAIRSRAIEICETALNKPDYEVPLDEKRKFIKSLTEIDKLNIDEEKIYTPKINLHGDISKLQDHELELRERQLEAELKLAEETNKKQLELKPKDLIEQANDMNLLIKRNNVL